MPNELSMDEWREQLQRMVEMWTGPSEPPGLSLLRITAEDRKGIADESARMLSVLDAMKAEERADLSLLDDVTRLERIAAAAGCSSDFVQETLTAFRHMRQTLSTLPRRCEDLVQLPPDQTWPE